MKLHHFEKTSHFDTQIFPRDQKIPQIITFLSGTLIGFMIPSKLSNKGQNNENKNKQIFNHSNFITSWK